MSRIGASNNGNMVRAMLSYGITEDLQLSISAPYMFSSAALPISRGTAMMSATPDVEAIGAWRFHRRGADVGTRFESTAYAGVTAPGPQRGRGMMADLRKAPGFYSAASTGMASRSHYVWGGVGYTRFAEAGGDKRPDILSYSGVWGYRPPGLRKEYPHWDWRGFLEVTGEKSGRVQRRGLKMPNSAAHQIFAGPSALGIYKNYAIEGGIQFPIYRDVGTGLGREKIRIAVNFSYFF